MKTIPRRPTPPKFGGMVPAGRRALEAYAELVSPQKKGIYPQYQDNPLGFIRDVLGIELLPKQQEIVESVWRYKRTVVISATGVGKTFVGAVILLTVYKLFEWSEGYVTAPPPVQNLRRLMWAQLATLVKQFTDVFTPVADKLTDLQLVRLHGGQPREKQWVQGLTIPTTGSREEKVSKFSGKHNDNLLFVFDEADGIPDEAFEGADGCLSGGNMQRMLLFLNPKTRGGQAYWYMEDGEANVITFTAFDHINVITGENVIPGAVSRTETLQRMHNWSRPATLEELEKLDESNPPDSFYMVPDFLVGVVVEDDLGNDYPPMQGGWRVVIENQFYYKVLARFPIQDEQQLVGMEHIAAARSRWDLYVAQYGEVPPAGVKPIFGGDVGDTGDDSAGIFRYGGYLTRPTRYKNNPTNVGLEWAQNCQRADACLALIDAIGVGAGVPQTMINAGFPLAAGVKVSESPTIVNHRLGHFTSKRDQLYFLMGEWVRSAHSMLPPDEELLKQLAIVKYETRNGKVLVTRKDVMKKLLKGKSPNEMEALAMTFSESRFHFGTL